ncbi:conserved protein of unknown function (plasmid) [Rhodovastum atsumiense]|uniref:DUF4258 domain-containing protein n=1 Tax=Rhodovastum atsumiense TaxID=504468 RepID=A0A5M6IVD5_9PROT|nr:hypothetical protein [Rhodovastum atsumiense]KAA5611807.1 hypothetical protein F1189_12260 [Rhodovastum atsumiense]CAH2606085.1 conserved protein of unknown function [Rhodovastum atsumiense]
MSIAGGYFVTPHAVRRFRERIAPLPERHALAAIIKSLESPDVRLKPQRDGVTVVVRTRAPFRFRAFVVPSEHPGGMPAVATIFEG